ncbi:MAG TPA: hypothetical protein VE130_06540 [Nitrososphaeraceae archaeon]|nr:hypothetical protein [Nitrososphaeraceae archaeon]
MTQSTRLDLKTLAAIAGITIVVLGSLTNLKEATATKYESSQASSLANGCGNGEMPLNIFCQNLASQIDGDGNAINIIALQPSSSGDDLHLLPH